VSTLEPEEAVTAVVEDGTVNGTEKTLEVVEEVQQEQQRREPEQGDAGDAPALSLEEKGPQYEVRVTDPSRECRSRHFSLDQAGDDDNNATDTSSSGSSSSSSNNTETGGAD
jgi:hypothetical protein